MDDRLPNPKCLARASHVILRQVNVHVPSKYPSQVGSHVGVKAQCQVQWKCPPRLVINSQWQVAAGNMSKETNSQIQREMGVLEADYPHGLAIPPNPIESTGAAHLTRDDQNTPLVPLTPIEEEDALAAFLLPPAPANETSTASTTMSPVSLNSSNNGPESLINHHLLLKILSEPKLIVQLLADHLSMLQNAPSTGAPLSAFDPQSIPNPSSVAIGTKDTNYYNGMIHQHGGIVQKQDGSQKLGSKCNELRRELKVKGKKYCFYFNTSKGCRNGTDCLFLHEDSSSQQRIGSIPEANATKKVVRNTDQHVASGEEFKEMNPQIQRETGVFEATCPHPYNLPPKQVTLTSTAAVCSTTDTNDTGLVHLTQVKRNDAASVIEAFSSSDIIQKVSSYGNQIDPHHSETKMMTAPLRNPSSIPPNASSTSSPQSVIDPAAHGTKGKNYNEGLSELEEGELEWKQERPRKSGNKSNNQHKKRDSKSKKRCIHFNSAKGCWYGANCSFRHDKDDGDVRKRAGNIEDGKNAKKARGIDR